MPGSPGRDFMQWGQGSRQLSWASLEWNMPQDVWTMWYVFYNHRGSGHWTQQWEYSPQISPRPFPSCCEPHYGSEAKCKAYHMKISFVCVWMKTNVHNKNFALRFAFAMRFEATQKWPTDVLRLQIWTQNYVVILHRNCAFSLHKKTFSNSSSMKTLNQKTIWVTAIAQRCSGFSEQKGGQHLREKTHSRNSVCSTRESFSPDRETFLLGNWLQTFHADDATHFWLGKSIWLVRNCKVHV